jgi:hypothetical protein
LFTDPFTLSPHIVEAFERIKADRPKTIEDKAALEDARAFLAEVRAETLVYEGAIKKPGEKGASKATAASRQESSFMGAAVCSNLSVRMSINRRFFIRCFRSESFAFCAGS